MMPSAMWFGLLVAAFGLPVAACCSFAESVGRHLGVIDHPDGGRKSHARPTPMVGGIALMVPLLLVVLAMAALKHVPTGVVATLVVIGLGFLLLGWYDDRRHAPPAIRLVISAGLFGAVILLNPDLLLTRINLGPQFLNVPLWMLSLPFTIVCLVGLQNSINMVDGMNGLLIGLALFWTSCLMMYAPDHLVIYLRFLMLGLAIVLPYNLRGTLFLGDAGSYSIGATIGALMIYVCNQSAGALPMLTVVLWLLVPVLDCLRVMVARLGDDRSPLSADENHLHHRLARHWRWPACLAMYLTLVAGPGLVAAISPDLTLPMIVLASAAYLALLWATRLPRTARSRESARLVRDPIESGLAARSPRGPGRPSGPSVRRQTRRAGAAAESSAD
jgi:UDP-GlcNAc:undecaprenyl-phosphate GlcNAc-1-phosphate transferase